MSQKRKNSLNPIVLGLGAAVVSMACFSVAANAAVSPFSIQLAANDATVMADGAADKTAKEAKCGASHGKAMDCDQMKKAMEGKCGEGKCGAKKKAKMKKMMMDAKCDKGMEGKCGAAKKEMEGKCGAAKKAMEGKCGAGKKAMTESK